MIIYLIIIFILIFLIYFIVNNTLIKYNKKEYFTNETYTAIIIEPRKHNALKFVLENFALNLDNNWNFIIFHGNNNIEFINNIINESHILKNMKYKIKLENLNVDNLTIDEYNKLLVSKDFYTKIPTEIFLIFQTDTMICNKYNNYINNFLNYDYVGAPWKEINEVGNGGLSLRRKSKMLEILNKCEYKNNINEDVYFSFACDGVNLNKPDYETSKQFSVETIYNDKSFGVHKPWIHLNKNLINNKIDYCNGLDELINLNL